MYVVGRNKLRDAVEMFMGNVLYDFKKYTLPVTPFLIFGANEKSSCFLCETVLFRNSTAP